MCNVHTRYDSVLYSDKARADGNTHTFLQKVTYRDYLRKFGKYLQAMFEINKN